MKNFLLMVLAVILAMIAISSFGNIVGLAISLLIVYYSFKQFMKNESIWPKVAWAAIGLFGFSGLMANLPAIAGIAAIYILYIGYKSWKQEKSDDPAPEHDPFSNFENEWNKLKNKFEQ